MNETENAEIALKAFVKGLRDFMPRGGSKAMAETIGMKESAFCRFINAPERAFDRPTLLAYSLMQQMRSEAPPGSKLTASGEFGPFLFKEWQKEDGELTYTWSPNDK